MVERLLEQLASSLNDALPQTQCTRCGYPDCDRYARAIACGEASVNRCPPGGAEGVARLAALASSPLLPLDPDCGFEAPRRIAVIDEATCIGCTLCLKACPVDCIVGAAKQMHTVINLHCTGCELCVPACPVDCISMPPATEGFTGWQAWSPRQAQDARERYERHRRRVERGAADRDQPLRVIPAAGASGTSPSAKRSVVAAALAKARSGRST